ncbi:MAG TPA: hypothetical protein PK028_07365 [Bacteroidales bacterium]|jgi:hypothetical protein|nr:hypothetical protein [Bacteroidales bacterium]MDI9573307.1 hypothetical protein [Bacteroidota bacterium]OQC60414.1 MAG: hypothetical protein BWX51_01002 [Bacteroidetes bacterium ADurb.Bin012]MBP9512246.1 hypothetical protein [Bacteroidales bacterium]MBP9588559.1 hypothetical protein [Bacteroidales bacterium]
MESDDNFEDKIEKLIRLFKKLKEQAKPETIAGFDPFMMSQLDFLISNFERMKYDPQARSIFQQMGKPFENMLNLFIKNLSEQLGEPVNIPKKSERETLLRPLPEEEKPSIGTLTRRLVQIDKLLAEGNLNQEEEDQLLDERIKIMKKLNPEDE